MKKIFKALPYAFILGLPISIIITTALNYIFYKKIFVISKVSMLLFFMLIFLSTVLLTYLLTESDRAYVRYDEHNVEIMDNIFIPKPIDTKFQYGSKWFIEKNNFDKYFYSSLLENNELIKRLENEMEVPEHVFNKYKLKKGGLNLGLIKEGGVEKLYYNADDTHGIVLGATRSGKGRNVLLQTIGIQGLAGENIIVSDPKGELFCYTNEYLKRLGYEVIALDFEEPEKSNSYNFLQNVIDYVNEGDMNKAIESTDDIVEMMVEKSEPIWENGEKSVLAFAILIVVIENKNNPEYQNLSNVYHFLTKMCTPDSKGIIPLNRYLEDIEDSHPAKMKASILLISPARTRGSFLASALSTLRLFTNPFIYEMCKQTDFDISNSEKKRAIFIILPDQKTTYNSLAGLFISQYYNSLIKNAKRNGNRLERRVNFDLDEFGNYPPINGMASKITVSAGYGIRFNLFLQSFAQLDSVYEDNIASTIKDNAEYLLYLKTTDQDTLQELSNRLGTYTAINVTESNGKDSFTSSTSFIERPLLKPSEIEKIKRPNTLVIKSGDSAILYAPDLSEYNFNKMFGMGDQEHNRKLILKRQENRHKKEAKEIKMELWDNFYKSLKEELEEYVED